MHDSILTTIKQMLGIVEEDTSFDNDVLVAINTAIAALCQIGVGPSNGYIVRDDGDTWDDFLGESVNMENAKTYIYIKSRIIFDPPSSGTVMEAFNNMASEIEWRLSVQREENQK